MRVLLFAALASCAMAADPPPAVAFDPREAIAGTVTIATAYDHCPSGTVHPRDVIAAVRVFSSLTGANTAEAGRHLENLANLKRSQMSEEEFARFCLIVLRASTT